MDSLSPALVAPDDTLPEQRDCTRCGGTQSLVAVVAGMGKYQCDTCQLVIGFDLDAEPREFLLDRGMPGAYTKDVFGPHLSNAERRL